MNSLYKIGLIAISIILTSIYIMSCGGQSTNSTQTSVSCTATNPPAYTNDVDKLLNNNCVTCHSAFATYAGAAGSASSISAQVNSGNMPKNGSLSQADRDAIVQWAACGAKQ